MLCAIVSYDGFDLEPQPLFWEYSTWNWCGVIFAVLEGLTHAVALFLAH